MMNDFKKAAEDFCDDDFSRYIPHFSINSVILGFHAGTLRVLLTKFRFTDTWILPFGFVYKTENVEDAAYRILESRTSLRDVYLKQFHLFGNNDRKSNEQHEDLFKVLDIKDTPDHWLRKRFLSMGHYALVEYGSVQVNSDTGEEISWFDLDDLPKLYGDHDDVINKAIESIRNDIGYIPIGYQLLPAKFTMPELRIIYEIILGRPLDRRNFQRKMLSIGLIEPLNETRKEGAYKSPNLYCFNKERYEDAIKNGLQLMHIIL